MATGLIRAFATVAIRRLPLAPTFVVADGYLADAGSVKTVRLSASTQKARRKARSITFGLELFRDVKTQNHLNTNRMAVEEYPFSSPGMNSRFSMNGLFRMAIPKD